MPESGSIELRARSRRNRLGNGQYTQPWTLTMRFLFVACFCQCVSMSFGSLYVNNATYDTLPALFGRYMMDMKTYDARLQYLHSNPYLCEVDDKTLSQFVPPVGPTIPNPNGHHGGGNITLYGEPVALLVVRGNCPFQRKATVAESIHESIKFLLVANFNLDNTPEGEDMLVPMTSDYGETQLVLLSVSHASGQSLKKFVSEQSDDVMSLGGPIIKLDTTPPDGMMSPEDIQSMLLSALGLFFMLMSCTGCLIILAGTYSQIAYLQDGSAGGENPVAAVTQRRLLTQREVDQLTRLSALDVENSTSASENATMRPSTTSRVESAAATGLETSDDNDASLDEPEEDQCAVCLGDFDESPTTVLPCRHRFHTSCIAPWLTERQSKCPLCKFDVLQYIREQEQEARGNGNSNSSISSGDGIANGPASIWHHIQWNRWTRVQSDETLGESESAAAHRRRSNDALGVELAEQQRSFT